MDWGSKLHTVPIRLADGLRDLCCALIDSSERCFQLLGSVRLAALFSTEKRKVAQRIVFSQPTDGAMRSRMT